jgi:asparagine synthase (glutamine-hydrolysing)
MSGLCGWFGRDGAEDPRAIIERMARALPRHGQVQSYSLGGAQFGLALQTHPSTGSLASDSDLAAAIEGSPIWSDATLAEIAKAEGHARALLAAYRRKGMALTDVLRGAFSFALVDIRAEKVFAAIDRSGIQTLCYAQPQAGLLVFGSTTDAVRAHPKVEATVTTQSVFDYLYFTDRVPAPQTIYREQRKLAPAEALRFESGRATVNSYWQMPYRSAVRLDKAAAAEELKRRLRNAVKASLGGEDGRNIGAFLSGGLDSSSVVGVAAGLLPSPLQTFTIGFPAAEFDETHYADIAVAHFHTKHRSYVLRPEDTIKVLLQSVQIYDEPFGNSSLIPAYYCAQMARDAGVEVMLAGDGGDELFAGNKRYVVDSIFEHYAKLPSLLRRRLLEPAADHLSFARNGGPIGKVLRYVEHARKSVPERMADNMFGTFGPGDVFAPEALREIDLLAPLALAEGIYDAPHDASRVQRMMHLDLRITLADSDLRKVVRMCELAGVRSRFPLLDDDLVEFSAGLPETLLMEGGTLRGFYKHAMRDFLPDEIINKQKHGFGLPYLSFMNSHAPLRELVCDTLTQLQQRKYFRREFLNELIARSRTGNISSREAVAWDLVALELWLASRRVPL